MEQIKQRTLGPVSDLERHLPGDWWKKLFNSLYLKTDGDVVENLTNTQADIDLLIQCLNPKLDDCIVDLCCGQGRHALELARRRFVNVTGIDRSRYLIRLARKRAKGDSLIVKFSEGDARKIRLEPSSQDIVYLMGNSFGYFEREEDDEAVLKSIKNILKSRGQIAMDIMDGAWMRENMESRSWEWIDQNHFVCRERTLSADQKRVISREVIVHAEKGVIADQFYSERLYDRGQIISLLQSLEYQDVTVLQDLKSESTRGQDLGMMAHRMFVVATAPAKLKRRALKKVTPQVAVLLGDPSLPDQVKKDGQFNEEDLQTTRKLKSALAELGAFEFRYVDHHAHMSKMLEQKRPHFVFNLCDEGMNNLAIQELHVPAMLELMNIPYSGAGPACLALCYNKSIVCSVAKSLDIPVPEETFFDPLDQAASLPSIFPALLKPNCGDSSIGITKEAVVYTATQLLDYLDTLKELLPNIPILIQEYLSGREFSVGLIGNSGNYSVLPILEVNYSGLPDDLPQILSYESKWLPDSPYWNNISYQEANLSENQKRQLLDYSIKLFERTNCRDYARFDFRTDKNGVIKLLEVNPNPGWCWDGKLNIMAGFQGMSYSELLELIIKAAMSRNELIL